MANLYQCKCGAPLEVSEDGKTGKCAYCGATVVFPKAGFHRMNKANELRQLREFDQAEGIYRSLTIAFPDEPEIWWSIVLCEYGIEYVEEEKDGIKKTIPTINRMKYESIFEQESFKKAISLADDETKAVYEAEAHRIDDIQKSLQEIVAKEEKYDVFISFKDKDDKTGERTLDSALAQEIYDALTKEGYKVFFSRITLRKMVGQEFEPKIFAALNSASMMIVVTCKKEHTESTWVKNEWSRYLKLMEKDADKYLLPVYAEMKPEDLPKKLAPMEGIEANGVNYMKLILKNVGERIGYKKKQRLDEKIVQDVAILEEDEVRRITERGYNAIKTGRFDQADEYFEQALDINVCYAPAWWGKLAFMTRDFTLECDIFEDEDMKRCYEEAMENATEEEKQRFLVDMERFERQQRRYQAENLMEEFMEETNDMKLVYSDGTEEEDKIQEELVEMQNRILELSEEQRTELKEQFDAYNHKQSRVKQLKQEYLAIENENNNLLAMISAGKNIITEDKLKIAKAKELYGMKLFIFGAVLCLPNAIALFISDTVENGLLPFVIGIFCVYKIWKKKKDRDKYCGGSVRELQQTIQKREQEVKDLYQVREARLQQLPVIYKELQEKYIDVKGYVIPAEINDHIRNWNNKLRSI